MKCYECKKGELKKQQVNYLYQGVPLGKFTAEVCGMCNEQFFDETASKKIEEAAKRAGVWGLTAKTSVGVVGNSLDIRIAKKLADFVGLKKGTEVTVHPEGKNKLVIEVM